MWHVCKIVTAKNMLYLQIAIIMTTWHQWKKDIGSMNIDVTFTPKVEVIFQGADGFFLSFPSLANLCRPIEIR